MKKNILLTFFLACILSGASAQRVQFFVNLPMGYKYSSELSISLVVEQEYMGIRYSTQMETSTTMNLQVAGMDPDSNYILTASYQKMNIQVSSLLLNMEVNSESTVSGDSLSLLLRSLKGKEFSIHLSLKGEVSEVTGLDEMIEESISSSTMPEEQKSEFTRNLIQSLGKEALQDNFSGNSSFYPDFTVRASDQWNLKNNLLKSGIPMELNSHVRLKNMNGTLANLVSEGSVRQQAKNSDQLVQSSDPQIFNLTGNEVSEVKMNMKTGLLMESIVSYNISGSIKTLSDEKNEQYTLVPFKISSRSTSKTTPIS